jgi:triacylglycerol lipase
MAWCRANIGIGTEFDQNEALDLRPSTSSSLDDPDDASIPLPYSLKSPILSREQVEAAKKAARADAMAEKVKAAATSLLPFNLSVSVTSYLLDLLDSPAYANLTPSFLRDVFNPSTPDLEGVKYYSIAARTEKIPIWHPLWLPKLVLDGAEAARIAKGVAAPPAWRGNDGLVSIDSARWGEFLGTFDACDHWEMRGSSGLISKEASKAAVEEMSRSEIRETKEPKEGEKAEKVGGGKENEDGWQWQDVYASVAHSVGGGKEDGADTAAKKDSSPSSTSLVKLPKDDKEDHSHDAQGLASAASWIVRQLPGSSSSSDPSSPILSPRGRAALESAEHSLSAVTSAASSVGSATAGAASTVVDNVMHNRATKLLYGAPGLSTSASSDAEKRAEEKGGKGKKGEEYTPPAKPEKFSLEQMTVAICRKLYNEGL